MRITKTKTASNYYTWSTNKWDFSIRGKLSGSQLSSFYRKQSNIASSFKKCWGRRTMTWIQIFARSLYRKPIASSISNKFSRRKKRCRLLLVRLKVLLMALVMRIVIALPKDLKDQYLYTLKPPNYALKFQKAISRINRHRIY